MITIEKLYWIRNNEIYVNFKCKKCGEKDTTCTYSNRKLDSYQFRMTGLFGFIAATRESLGLFDGDLMCPNIVKGLTRKALEMPGDYFVQDYFLAARLNMVQMLEHMRPYLTFLLQENKCSIKPFFDRLVSVNSKIACGWASFAFDKHDDTWCYCSDEDEDP